jgi:chromosome partitioning protein
VIALDLDSQASLVRWSERRKTANVANRVVIEPLETERLPQIPVILEGLAGIGFTVALFDTADADAEGVRRVIDSVDLCLVPARPTPLEPIPKVVESDESFVIMEWPAPLSVIV